MFALTMDTEIVDEYLFSIFYRCASATDYDKSKLVELCQDSIISALAMNVNSKANRH